MDYVQERSGALVERVGVAESEPLKLSWRKFKRNAGECYTSRGFGKHDPQQVDVAEEANPFTIDGVPQRPSS